MVEEEHTYSLILPRSLTSHQVLVGIQFYTDGQMPLSKLQQRSTKHFLVPTTIIYKPTIYYYAKHQERKEVLYKHPRIQYNIHKKWCPHIRRHRAKNNRICTRFLYTLVQMCAFSHPSPTAAAAVEMSLW